MINSATLIFFLLLILHANLVHAKYKVCTITINSSDEAQTFKSQLNPSEFEFVELTASTPDWAQRSCRPNLNCDILIISGHFGGEFFSDNSPLRLPLFEMEKLACQQNCEGIFKYPVEVFLFGCNTLSEKNADHRTPEEYYEVLREHQFPPELAQTVVESRYGILGEDFKSRIQKVFSKSPHIYGFSSKSPVGLVLKPKIQNYLKKVKDYKKHIDKLHLERMSGQLGEINHTLSRSIHHAAFEECSGTEIQGSNEKLKTFCRLINPSQSDSAKEEVILEMLSSEEYLKNIPIIVESINQGLVKDQVVNRAIGNNLVIKERVLGLLKKLSGSPLVISYASFAKNQGWLTVNEEKEIFHTYLKAELEFPGSTEKTDRICSLPKNVKSMITISDLDPIKKRISSVPGARLMNCLEIEPDENYLKQVAIVLNETQNDELKKNLIWSTQKQIQKIMFKEEDVLNTNPVVLSEDQKVINKKIIQLVKKRHDLSTVIYSFSPGENLSSEEKKFIKETLLKGPDFFPGWQYTWLLRVATRSSYLDLDLLQSLSKFQYHDRAKTAITEYRDLWK